MCLLYLSPIYAPLVYNNFINIQDYSITLYVGPIKVRHVLVLHVSMVGLAQIMDHHLFVHALLGSKVSAVKSKVTRFSY